MIGNHESKEPVVYRLKVRGKLRESWSDWFDDMVIAFVVEGSGSPVTTLTGPVVDQSALHGMLNRIRDLGLPLLSVNQVMEDQEQEPSSKSTRLGSRRGTRDTLGKLAPADREALLIQCWMSHDARWFMTVATEFGVEVANRVNQTVAHELGKVEARRIHSAFNLGPVLTLEDYLVVQELLIDLLGPDLLDYHVSKRSDCTYQIAVRRCFAHENVQRAGIANQYECGILSRMTGWMDNFGFDYEVSPVPGKCPIASGQDCIYTIMLERNSSEPKTNDEGKRTSSK
jgi:hypothetical protein